MLIVDDEPAVLKVLSRILGAQCVVELASSGVIALDLLAASPPFDVVLCDVNLRDLAGPDVYARASARWPELRERFLFMTGEGASAVAGFGDESSRMRVLAKPFDVAALRSAVVEVLDRRAALGPA